MMNGMSTEAATTATPADPPVADTEVADPTVAEAAPALVPAPEPPIPLINPNAVKPDSEVKGRLTENELQEVQLRMLVARDLDAELAELQEKLQRKAAIRTIVENERRNYTKVVLERLGLDSAAPHRISTDTGEVRAAQVPHRE